MAGKCLLFSFGHQEEDTCVSEIASGIHGGGNWPNISLLCNTGTLPSYNGISLLASSLEANPSLWPSQEVWYGHYGKHCRCPDDSAGDQPQGDADG